MTAEGQQGGATHDFEKMGVFYLGRQYDLDARKSTDNLFLYPSKDLLTHALCVGMTGSGKTGLCLALLEEAAIDGIPAIVVDPKGDLSNLLLTFPALTPEDFRPFIDEGEATRKGTSVDLLAQETAHEWKRGLAAWGQDGARVARFRSAADVVVYTPASAAGVQLSLLGSFDPPPAAVLEDAEAFAGLVEGAASSLLGLAGVSAELRSREHVFVSQIFASAWATGKALDLAQLVQTVQKPPFDRVGALDLETFFPAKDRNDLAMAVNALVASPSAAIWARGEPLDVAKLLRTPEGKPRIAVLSIAHLSDEQRMFFVTKLLDATVAWMRQQSGTTSLRALLYMDEIFGYFPPTAMPPSKRPMLTLLKQARAFGLGIVLATQNPVDLDYKGLANCGTWFLGRLQTERDKLRILDGLEGAHTSTGNAFDRATLDNALSGLEKRVFLCNDVHAGAPSLFQSRHTLSYLRGPLTREQLSRANANANVTATATPTSTPTSTATARPAIGTELEERFFPCRVTGTPVTYRPGILVTGQLHYVLAKAKIDQWRPLAMVAPFVAADVAWEHATLVAPAFVQNARPEPEPGAAFELPPSVTAKKVASWNKQLVTHLVKDRALVLFKNTELGELSNPGESLAEFQARTSHAAREDRDARIAALEKKYAPKFEALADKIRRAQAKIQKEQSDVQNQQIGTAVSFGSGVLGAVFGRGVLTGANVNRAGSVVKGAQRVAKEKDDVARAVAEEAALRQKWAELQAQANGELERLRNEAHAAPTSAAIEELRVAPRKADIAIDRFLLAWVPFRAGPSGALEPAW